MNFKYFIGIDISKATLDISILHQGKKIVFKRIKNDEESIKLYINQILLDFSSPISKLLFMMEFTGIYNNPIVNVLEGINAHIWQANAIHIKRSGGLQRGKTDKLDSFRIAMFAYRNIDQYRLHIPIRKELQEIKRLFTVRNNLVKTRTQIKALLSDHDFITEVFIKNEQDFINGPIKVLNQQILALDNELKFRILNDEKLCRLYNIITSVKGIAIVTAIKIIIVTNEFKKINNPKALACLAGIAPFAYSSGSSVKKLTRVSNMGDKDLKKLLHMAAISAMTHPGELHDYYLRKLEQGVHKMKIINNIRNKLIHRICACVNNNRIYSQNYNPTTKTATI